MKTLKIYHRLIWGCAYTQNEVSNAILNLFIALAENDEQSIRSIIELYEITHTELLQIQELTGKAIKKVVPKLKNEDRYSLEKIDRIIDDENQMFYDRGY
jgi:hypothetical protein